MKDKSNFRLISIGFLSGIVFSGLVFLSIYILHVHNLQNFDFAVTPVVSAEKNQNISTLTNGKININQATLSELITLPGIGETKANAIIEFRKKYGDFENVTELSYVPGIGNALLKSIQDLVIIN
jgi:competence protein ComEA